MNRWGFEHLRVAARPGGGARGAYIIVSCRSPRTNENPQTKGWRKSSGLGERGTRNRKSDPGSVARRRVALHRGAPASAAPSACPATAASPRDARDKPTDGGVRRAHLIAIHRPSAARVCATRSRTTSPRAHERTNHGCAGGRAARGGRGCACGGYTLSAYDFVHYNSHRFAVLNGQCGKNVAL